MNDPDAGSLCFLCRHGLAVGKDPDKGWIHVDSEAYKEIGDWAVYECRAPEVHDRWLRREEILEVIKKQDATFKKFADS